MASSYIRLVIHKIMALNCGKYGASPQDANTGIIIERHLFRY